MTEDKAFEGPKEKKDRQRKDPDKNKKEQKYG